MGTQEHERHRSGSQPAARTFSLKRRLAAPPRRTSRRRGMEPLEDRRLLSLSNLLPQFADPLTGERSEQWNPKQGQFSTIDESLFRTSQEHRYRIFTDNGDDFMPSDPEIMVAGGSVVIDAYATTDGAALEADIARLGGQITGSIGNLVSAFVPLQAIDSLSRLTSLAWAEAAHAPVTNAGLVQSQGDAAMASDAARALGVDGTGIKVGIISDSFNRKGGYATDLANGEFPTPVTTIIELPPLPGIVPVDEGRALAQIIADVAPGAQSYFNTGVAGLGSFVAAIDNLREAGANLIVDDLIYLSEPMFQDGPIAQAIAESTAAGVAHFSSAGNYGDHGADFGAFDVSDVTGVNGGPLHDFDSGPGVDTFQRFTLPVGQSIRLSFQWDEPFFVNAGSFGVPSPGSASDVDILILNEEGTFAIAGGVALNVGRNPLEIFQFVNDGTFDFDEDGVPDTEFNVAFELFFGPAPGRMKYVDFDGGMIIEEYSASTSTSFGHFGAEGVFAVAAAPYFATPAFGTSPAILNEYSSRGRQEILFDPAGNRLAEPIVRHHPDVTGPDQVDTSFFVPGIDIEPNGLPNFPGTSASAPHVAAVAALMLDAAGGPGSLSVQSLYTGLKNTALDILQRKTAAPEAIPGAAGYDYFSGHGLVDALAAVNGALNGFDLAFDANDVAGDPGVNDGDPADDGIADTFTVSLVGAEVVVVINGIEAARMDLAAIDTLTINGSSDDDELIVDLSGGNPIPAGGMEFQGGSDAGTGDRVRWLGGAPTDVIHTLSSADAGATLSDGSLLDFTGVELVTDLLTPLHRELRFTDDSQFVTLSDGDSASDGVVRMTTGSTSPTLDFAGATGETRLVTGAGDDQFQVDALDDQAFASLEISLGDGDDQVFIVPQLAAALHLDGGPELLLDELSVNALDSAVVDTGAELQFAGYQNVTYTEFERLSISNAGEGGGLPDVTVAGVSLAEGSSGGITEMTFTVTLSVANPNQTVFVDYFTTDDTAENELGDGDYLAVAGTLEFPPNSLQQTVVVQVLHDTTLEGNEEFILNLANGVNANLLDEQAIGVIVNDDFPPATVAYVDDDWAGLPLGVDPDGSGPALSFGADSFADFPAAVAAIVSGGTILIYPGQYHGATIDKNVSVLAASSGVTISGASPAITVLGGIVSLNGITLDTQSDDATVVVVGGALSLRAMTVFETSNGAQAVLRRTGGAVNLGDASDAGLNSFEVRGAGSLIDNQSSSGALALGNSWLQDGATLDNFQIEDRIEHAIDESGRGLVTWVDRSLFVTSLTPGDIDATHNNYRRLANMAAVLDDGFTAFLMGTFDFSETSALADWELGNDGLPNTDDDFAVQLPGDMSGVILTAAQFGDATILGPGDLAVVDLEGVFRFSGQDTHNWEISRLRIFDFDLSIDASPGEGNADARDGLLLADNHVRLATDLNFAVAPADFFQNIGIALGPGRNQTVRGNRIDIPGNAVADGSQFAASVGIQSRPENATAYDELLIENNTIEILNAPSADPSTIIGIWDAGAAHESDITIRGNQFLNADAENDALSNLQRAFRVGSQSGAATTVKYEDNTVRGANIAFQWQPNTNLAGHEPVLLHNNAMDDVFKGIVVSSQGSAHISGNELIGLGPDHGIGIDVQLGSSAMIDGVVDDNSIERFAKGIFVKGSASVVGNAATISGNDIGIDIDGGAASISGNRIDGNVTGIRITDGGDVTSISNNFIVDNASDGVRITGTAGDVGPIFNNSLSGNGNRSIRNQSGELVDASGNWWGVSTSAGVNQEAQGDVDFTPWLDSGKDVDGDPANGFQGDFSTLHVDDDSPQAAPSGRIQEGVSWALAAGTLIIHDGLYRESNSTVDRPLRIIGESRSGVVIAPGAEDDHTDIAFGGVFQQGFIIQSSDVTIQTLTIDGQANPALTPGRNNFRTGVIADRRTGVVYDRTRIENIDVLHIRRRGIELFSSEAAGSLRSFDNIVRGNRIEDVTVREAILVREGNALIIGNEIEGARIGVGANDRGDFTNAPVVIIQKNQMSRVQRGIALSGVANGSLVGGLGDLGNLIDLTQGTTADIGVFAQYSQGQVAIAGNTILAERDDAAIWLFHNEDASRPIVVANNRLIGSQSSSDGPGRGVGVFLTDDGDLFGDEDGSSYATIQGNAITGFEIGIDLYRNGDSPAGGRAVEATIGGATSNENNALNDNSIGVRIFESDAEANGGRLAVAHILGNGTSITGGRIGIDVNGGAAEIVGNRIADNGVGVRVVREGIALLEDNDLRDNSSIGLLIETGGIVDAGQEGLGVDFTGFGVSLGGNDFRSYTPNADEDDGAIVNRNEDDVAGPQGSPPDVAARGNLFFSTSTSNIEKVVYHDVDDNDLGFVDFFGLQNLVLSFSSDPASEGTPVTLHGSFENAALGPHDVTIDWGDGQVDHLTLPAGVLSLSVLHTYDDDDPTGTPADVYPVLVRVEESFGPSFVAKQTSLTVNNVAPTLSDVEVTSEIDENGEVKLKGLLGDASALDSFTLVVDWGDGHSETQAFAAGATEFAFTHQYLDDAPSGTSADEYTIHLTLTDDDLGVTEEKVTTTVNNVAPRLSDLEATPSVDEGGEVHLTGSIADAGALDSFVLNVNWGDGTIEAFPFPAGASSFDLTHRYADDDPSGTSADVYPIQVSLGDDDGGEDHEDVTTTVKNVAPIATIDSAPLTGAIGAPIALTGSFTDVGAEDTHALSWEVLRDGLPFDLGSGAAFSFTPTTGGSYQVTFKVVDDDLGEDTDVVTIDVPATPEDAPAVLKVLVSSTEWSDDFLDVLEATGYAIPAGGAQWATLPWEGLNQIQIMFTEDVDVSVEALSITGVHVASYSVDSFVYDALTFTATWTLDAAIGNDRVSLTLSDAIVDLDDGLALDGEWINAESAFPSGDATAGGEFVFGFRVLPGDIDQTGEVDLADLNFVRNNFGELTSNIFGDLSGSGAIDLSDLNSVRNNFGEVAVPIPPPPPPMTAGDGGSVTDQLFTIDAADDEADDWWTRHHEVDAHALVGVDQAAWESVLEVWNEPEA